MPRRHRHLLAFATAISVAVSVTGCSGGAPSLVGTWTADDGSSAKTFQDSGYCTAMYYNQGKPLDIGGGMTCTLGSKKNDDGRYALQVNQPPNAETLYLSFDSESKATVYAASGTRLFTMAKQ